MKIPHVFFGILNRIMVLLLRSPLHRIFSGSILAMGYVGVRSGREFWVPARYIEQQGELRVVTAKQNKWWPNFRDGLDVRVLVKGDERAARATVTTDQPDVIGPVMRDLWARHPADAAYMDVRMRGREPVPDDFERAVAQAVLVRLVLREPIG